MDNAHVGETNPGELGGELAIGERRRPEDALPEQESVQQDRKHDPKAEIGRQRGIGMGHLFPMRQHQSAQAAGDVPGQTHAAGSKILVGGSAELQRTKQRCALRPFQ